MPSERPATSMPSGRPWHERPFVTPLLLLAAAMLPYLNTFDVPFYFDDTNNIVDNPLIRDLPQAARGVLASRGLAMLSFAVNFRLSGLEPAGYHAVNLAIHAGCVLLVWRLLIRLAGARSPWPAVGAALFAVHPLQTQAVTYVVQRMTSLSALFFLAAVVCYLAFLDREGPRRQVLYGVALLCGAFAVLTKENTAVLPMVLLLVERCFRPGRGWRAQLLCILPFSLVPAWKAVERLLLPLLQGEAGAVAVARYADQLQTLQDVTPLRYLFTEFSVLCYYLRLLVLPFGQQLDYAWPVVDRLLTLRNLAALAGLALLGVLAWRLRQRRPWLSLGIAWFFVTLSVESTILPLDPVFEHRLYLPMVGFVLVALDLLRGIRRPRLQAAAIAVILPLLAVLTWQRNALWREPVAFLEDNLRRDPENVRVMVMLGNAYAAAKRPDDGLRMVEQALQRNDRYDFAYTALGKMLIDRGEGARAIEPLHKGLQHQPRSVILNEYLGIAYGEAGDYRQALPHLRRALLLDPEDASVHANIGVVYAAMGDHRQAAGYFRRAVELAPDYEKPWFNYAATLFNLGDRQGALEALRTVVRINPANADAHYGRGVLAFEFGFREEAAASREALRRLGDEERARELDGMLGR